PLGTRVRSSSRYRDEPVSISSRTVRAVAGPSPLTFSSRSFSRRSCGSTSSFSIARAAVANARARNRFDSPCSRSSVAISSSASAIACLSIPLRPLRELPEQQRGEAHQGLGGADAEELLQLTAGQEVVELALGWRVCREMAIRG